MRVLQLVYSLDVGGLEQVVVDLCNNLKFAGVNCHIGCLSHKGPKFEQAKVDDFWIGGLSVNDNFLNIKILMALNRYVLSNKIDVIHSHNPVAHIYGTITSLYCKIPHIHTIHGRGPAIQSFKRVLLRRILSSLTDEIVAVSADVKEKLISVDRVNRQKVSTIINGVDTSCYEPVFSNEIRKEIRIKNKLPVDSFIIGSTGRFVTDKNYILLIDSFIEFNKLYNNSHLVLIGDGTEMKNINKHIQNNGISCCCTLPGIQHNISEWMKCFDIFSLSSITEGTSVTILEAMSSGLPIVATDVGGNRAVVSPPECGIIVPSGDKKSICSAFIEFYLNRNIYLSSANNARFRVVNNYSVKNMIDKYLCLYSKFL